MAIHEILGQSELAGEKEGKAWNQAEFLLNMLTKAFFVDVRGVSSGFNEAPVPGS